MIEDAEAIYVAYLNRSNEPPLPPPPFDVCVDKLSSAYAEKVWELAATGAIDGYLKDGQRWVCRNELQHYMTPGHCTYDPLSTAYIPFDEE